METLSKVTKRNAVFTAMLACLFVASRRLFIAI